MTILFLFCYVTYFRNCYHKVIKVLSCIIFYNVIVLSFIFRSVVLPKLTYVWCEVGIILCIFSVVISSCPSIICWETCPFCTAVHYLLYCKSTLQMWIWSWAPSLSICLSFSPLFNDYSCLRSLASNTNSIMCNENPSCTMILLSTIHASQGLNIIGHFAWTPQYPITR